MRDVGQGADLAASVVDRRVVHVPHRHGVGAVAERIVVGHRADAPDAAVGEHVAQRCDHLRFIDVKIACQSRVRPRDQRQAGLGGAHEACLEGFHAASLRPMKYSASRGRSITG